VLLTSSWRPAREKWELQAHFGRRFRERRERRQRRQRLPKIVFSITISSNKTSKIILTYTESAKQLTFFAKKRTGAASEPQKSQKNKKSRSVGAAGIMKKSVSKNVHGHISLISLKSVCFHRSALSHAFQRLDFPPRNPSQFVNVGIF